MEGDTGADLVDLGVKADKGMLYHYEESTPWQDRGTSV